MDVAHAAARPIRPTGRRSIHTGALRLRAYRCQPGVGCLDPLREFGDGPAILSPRSPTGEQRPPVRAVGRATLGQGLCVLGHLTRMTGGCDVPWH